MALFNRKRREPDEPQPESQDAAASESPAAEPAVVEQAAAEPAAPSIPFTTTTVGRADPANLSFAMPSAPVPEAPKAPVGPHHADVAASLQRWAKGNSPQALADVLRQLKAEGMSLLLVEHDMEFVMGLTDRIVVMEFGTKLMEGTPAEVQASPQVRAAYLGTEH